jgi:4,5-DOPA dioxygenase extradiol
MLSRRYILKTTALATSLGALSTMAQALAAAGKEPVLSRMPVLFIGHGSPMNAIQTNAFTQRLSRWAKDLPLPRAILVVSAHWLSKGVTGVTAHLNPPTIHDFSGFPGELHEMQYRAPGHPELAEQASRLVRHGQGVLTTQWGLDHGTWTVLRHLYPKADIPVFQVSIDYDEPGAFHLAVGRELAALRDQGVLIIGSGNIVHNLGATVRVMAPSTTAAREWAQDFDERVKAALDLGDDKALANYLSLGDSARMAVPTPDHYWPLLYAVGAAKGAGAPSHVYEGFQAGTLSMRCLQFG